MTPFEELQNMLQKVLPIVLIGPGIVLVGCGLFMWLGGLRWLKAVGAFTAAMAGLMGAWYFTGGQIVPMVLIPVILAGLGMFLNRLVVVLLGAGIVAGAIIVGPMMHEIDRESSPNSQVAAMNTGRMNLLESIQEIEIQVNRLKDKFKEMIANVPPSRKSVALVTGFAFAAIGILSWRLVCALTCSAIGTLFVFLGMMVLLLYKGTESLRQVTERGVFYTAVAAGMILLGTFLQMWLCPAKRKKKDLAQELLKEEKQK